MAKNISHSTYGNTKKVQTTEQSVQSNYAKVDNETIINSITGYEKNLGERLQRLEFEAGMQAQQIELNECIERIVQLVDLFKRTVITDELKNQDDWHGDTQRHLKQYKGVTGNRRIDEKVEKIVMRKGITKEQWNCLLYMVLSTDDTVELTKVSKKHLQKVRDKVLRLIEGNEQSAVCALIDAIEQHMSKNFLVDK